MKRQIIILIHRVKTDQVAMIISPIQQYDNTTSTIQYRHTLPKMVSIRKYKVTSLVAMSLGPITKRQKPIA